MDGAYCFASSVTTAGAVSGIRLKKVSGYVEPGRVKRESVSRVG